MHYRYTKRAKAAASKIDITKPAETSYWAHKLGCTTEQLRAAVKLVGDDAAAVTNYFLRVLSFKQPIAA
jgi:hypothetical protein